MTPAAAPTVFVIDDDDLVRTAIQGMLKSVGLRSETFGTAQAFLSKPFRDQQLLDAISQAIERDRLDRKERREVAELQHRYESLTPREREVMTFVVKGLLNKQVGAELGMSETTVKLHRGQVMQKMKADSLADLVRMAERLRPSADESRSA